MLAELFFITSAYALDPQLGREISAYVNSRKPPAATAPHPLAARVDEIEKRLLPMILNLNRVGPLLAQRHAELDSLKTFLESPREVIDPYKDPTWLEGMRAESKKLCCAIRRNGRLAMAIQENVANGQPAVNQAVLEELGRTLAISQSPDVFGKFRAVAQPPAAAAAKAMDADDPDRPENKARAQTLRGSSTVPPPADRRKGLISGLPDLAEPKPVPGSSGGASVAPVGSAPSSGGSAAVPAGGSQPGTTGSGGASITPPPSPSN